MRAGLPGPIVSAMGTGKRIIAAVEVALIFPAGLFMTALAVRGWRPPPHGPKHLAHHIVEWYTVRPWTFRVLLVHLPYVVFVTGCATLLWGWYSDRASRKVTPQADAPPRVAPATLVIAAATLAAGYILTIIAMQSLAD